MMRIIAKQTLFEKAIVENITADTFGNSYINAQQHSHNNVPLSLFTVKFNMLGGVLQQVSHQLLHVAQGNGANLMNANIRNTILCKCTYICNLP